MLLEMINKMNKKRVLTNGLLLFFSTLLGLLLVEQVFRVYLFGSDSLSITKMNSVHEIGYSGLLKPSDHLEITYELKPNLNTYFKLASVKTNTNGLRDKAYPFSKPDSVFRVAVLGDSFTMPAGVEIEEAYHSLLEERLTREQRELTYEFINFGVGGYNLRQYLGLMKFRIQSYDPDLILIGFCPHNDHEIRDDKHFEQRYVPKPATYPFYGFFILKALAKAIRLLGEKHEANQNKGPILTQEQREYVSDIFSEMKAYSLQKSIPVVIVNLSFVYDKEYGDELEELVVSHGLNYVDVTSRFKETSLWEYSIYRTDGHPNGKAHRIFAEEIYAYLSQHSMQLGLGPLDLPR